MAAKERVFPPMKTDMGDCQQQGTNMATREFQYTLYNSKRLRALPAHAVVTNQALVYKGYGKTGVTLTTANGYQAPIPARHPHTAMPLRLRSLPPVVKKNRTTGRGSSRSSLKPSGYRRKRKLFLQIQSISLKISQSLTLKITAEVI
ncbi:hypothetical protein EYF80_003419 [Liparis tanakae]|uniref:Uncharacterized protein n=1 Tax=Liparis tanakae TaxID=230148 RepID=A0A4Z2J956_9TELE|nr:hypothetical protein EYF80_003419 [Liparis tanakae]